ncbi:MAG: zf-HC2 domain-containing protein [Bacillota bacterium]
MNQCQTMRELMPWVVRGTASRPEADALYAHTAHCNDCRRELVALLALEKRIHSSLQVLPELPQGAWNRLAGRLFPEPESVIIARKLVSILEAVGLPAILTELIASCLELGQRRLTYRLNPPLMAVFEIKT